MTKNTDQIIVNTMEKIRKPDGFKSEKLIVLPDHILMESSSHPLVRPLYVTDTGYFPRALHHYRERPEGSEAVIVIFCMEGEGWYRLGNDRVQPVGQGQAIVIPAQTPHAYGSSEKHPWSIYWWHFKGEQTEAFFEGFGPGPGPGHEPGNVPEAEEASTDVCECDKWNIGAIAGTAEGLSDDKTALGVGAPGAPDGGNLTEPPSRPAKTAAVSLPVTLPPDKARQLAELFHEGYALLEQGYTLNHIIYVSQLAHHLAAMLRLCRLQPQDGIFRNSQHDITQTVRYMMDRLEGTVTLKQLAAQARVSVPHFTQRFKEATGYSPIDYYLRLKIQLACRHLDLTEQSVKEISHRLGFQDPYYFSRLFKKIMGKSPSEYRGTRKG
ncbi:AraC-like DNA-binding protein/mannose-6-phosphate isomerase-like protein (cupin superfamily) [Paenibacillus rhizosphaerae]|uniref:AraC-like DNA-binding protein/mannose-6-phosphate isomerase-like protein (Cupin superfamily) n=1 Tax=Paenibacillus rhizosphaerae TaxID=297318 RepID=A0A839TVX8_9BACL|nr:AraC family transcriptional regulator [Paenibacillus rhizosphaerae]MBB3131016.1 AraC-like DNA-binding protein/mannose-6-phosphate isomerase-like protein (cupin superfamily) [Paenibacillus rhizosphaerae]